MSWRSWIWVLMSVGLLSGCKSAYEKQGDNHLKEGRPFRALQRYQYVIRKGGGSAEFQDNLTKAYIMAMEKSVEEGAEPDKVRTYREKIKELLNTKGIAGDTRDQFAKAALSSAKSLIDQGDFESQEVGFGLLEDVEKMGSPGAVAGQIAKIRNGFAQAAIEEAQGYYQKIAKGAEENGILADYALSRAALFVGEVPEMRELWSDIRKANLSTYLMYDLQGLIPNPIPRINRFGVLLGITVFNHSGTHAAMQVKAYNGSTVIFTFDGNNFTLVDREGNEYKPVGKRGAFSTSKKIEAGDETGIGGLSFNVPRDAELHYLRFESEAGESIKYLP